MTWCVQSTNNQMVSIMSPLIIAIYQKTAYVSWLWTQMLSIFPYIYRCLKRTRTKIFQVEDWVSHLGLIDVFRVV